MHSRNYFLLGLFFFISTCYYSQGSISGITISPANPTIDDTITIYADLMFSNSSCEFFNSNQNISGNTINITTQHCYGMLTSICYVVDTFTIAPLVAGNYVIDLTLTSDINYGIVPCNGGNTPDDIDTLHFEVIDPSSITTVVSSIDFSLYPNPSKGVFQYEVFDSYDEIIVYSSKGQEVYRHPISSIKGEVKMDIVPGIYFVKFKTNNGIESTMKKILISE